MTHPCTHGKVCVDVEHCAARTTTPTSPGGMAAIVSPLHHPRSTTHCTTLVLDWYHPRATLCNTLVPPLYHPRTTLAPPSLHPRYSYHPRTTLVPPSVTPRRSPRVTILESPIPNHPCRAGLPLLGGGAGPGGWGWVMHGWVMHGAPGDGRLPVTELKRRLLRTFLIAPRDCPCVLPGSLARSKWQPFTKLAFVTAHALQVCASSDPPPPPPPPLRSHNL